jgi:hypothetical protein
VIEKRKVLFQGSRPKAQGPRLKKDGLKTKVLEMAQGGCALSRNEEGIRLKQG